jgi:UDP-N-acetylglucosamine 3-dehydrogenase
MANLRAGLIGLGSMGRNHARLLASLDGVDLVAVADPAGDPWGAIGSALLVETVEQLISTGVDYCVAAVPTALHEQIGMELARSGIHVLIEKPVAVDVTSATALSEAFESAGLIGAVGHIERYNPALQQLKSRLRAGDLGEIYQVATRRQGPFPARIADVGVVKDLATHDIDLTAWVTGQPFVSISARTAHKSGRDHEDLVAATGELADGTTTNHLVNWLSPMKERVTVVTGDLGTFEANTLTGDLTFYANGTVPLDWMDVAHFRGMTEGDVMRYAFPKAEPLRTEHEAFRDAVLGLDAEIVTLRQGLATVRVAEAMLESARTASTVSVSAESIAD